MKIDLSVEELRKILRYDKDTGIFTWLVAGSGRVPGARAGTGKTSDGHWSLSISGKRYKGHGIAWVMATGEEPPKPIKFRDGNSSNLCFDNLSISKLGVRPPKPKPSHTRRVYRKDNGWHVEVIDRRGTYRSGPWAYLTAAQADADARIKAHDEAKADPEWMARKVEIAAKISASRYRRPRVGEQPIARAEVDYSHYGWTMVKKAAAERSIWFARRRFEEVCERFETFSPHIQGWRADDVGPHRQAGGDPEFLMDDDWWMNSIECGAGEYGAISRDTAEDNLVMDDDAFAGAAGFDSDRELPTFDADDDATGFGYANDVSPTADPMTDDAEWL